MLIRGLLYGRDRFHLYVHNPFQQCIRRAGHHHLRATTVRNRLLHRIARIPRATASTNTPPSEGIRGKTEPTSASRQRPPTPRQTSATTTTGAMPRDSVDGHHGILSDKRMFVILILSQFPSIIHLSRTVTVQLMQ